MDGELVRERGEKRRKGHGGEWGKMSQMSVS